MARLSAARSAPEPAHQASDGGGYMVELPIGSDGHYHAEAEINGRPVQVLVDTGASMVALTAEDADAAGVFVTDNDFTPPHSDRERHGPRGARDPGSRHHRRHHDPDVRGVVSESGAMSVSLLGMTFLNELDRVDMRSGKLILQD